MPKVLADNRERIVLLAAKPADPKAPTVAELEAGIRAECLLSTESRISATGSETIDDRAICETTNAQTPGRSNYEGSLTLFRFLDPATGQPVAEEDEAWELLREKGTTVYYYESLGVEDDQPFKADDIVTYYELITDQYQKPSERSGYIKAVIPVFVQAAEHDVTVAGA